MFTVDADNVVEYLRATGRLPSSGKIGVEALSGGVSNVVLRIEPVDGPPFVVKQSREQLRTTTPWFSRLDRIWRETAVMRALGERLPAGIIPEIRFEDRENFLFAMEAAPAEHLVWKEELLAGRVSARVAAQLGQILAAIHASTSQSTEIASEFDDREIFVQLRVDPFYRHVAAVHPDLSQPLHALIAEMDSNRICLVHADFSPKNVLVTFLPSGDGDPVPRITLIDFETGHFGDPAFDCGFFLSHLLLKGVRARSGWEQFAGLAESFWNEYSRAMAQRRSSTFGRDAKRIASAFEPLQLERRTVVHLAACALARIDGTSPVGYLPDPDQRNRVRAICRAALLERDQKVGDLFSRLNREACRATN